MVQLKLDIAFSGVTVTVTFISNDRMKYAHN